MRYSDTLTQRTLYYACALDGGTVLRVSAGQATELALVARRRSGPLRKRPAPPD